MGRMRAGALGVLVMAGVVAFAPATQVTAAAGKAASDPVAEHWTAARMKAATPRDLVLDERGLAYLKQKDGTLKPHGHSTRQLYASPVSKPTANGKPGGGGDTTGPTIGTRTPADGANAGASQTFTANVTDPSGVRSVAIRIIYPNGNTQSFSTSRSGSTYSTTITGFTSGTWRWAVVATDSSTRRNVSTSAEWTLNVNTGGGSGGAVTNAEWTSGGTVQNAAGRIYFEMPTNNKLTSWAGYVCSGTVARDGTTGRSVIITAAHCVYDDAHKAFARSVIFIPNQDGTTGAGTDRVCSNDPIGCWTTSFGVVDTDWSSRVFPANIPWDYAYYVVNDTGAHTAGRNAAVDVLDVAAGDLAVQFTAPGATAYTHALGYSYADDPSFMYCAQNLGTESSYGDWWLSQCGLSGGSSGGPWMQPVGGTDGDSDGGDGPIISVNSWGYTNQPGMGGPRLAGSSAQCVFGVAKGTALASVTNRGVATPC
jgi:hypothetical protein